MGNVIKKLKKELLGETDKYQQVKYRAPNYLIKAAKKKFGDDIFVLGATPDELSEFWSLFEKNAKYVGAPQEMGRTVVDIDAKSHINTGEGEQEDNFKIISGSNKTATKSSSTSYQLHLAVQKESQVGANLNFKVGGPAFFNLASGGLTAGASYKQSTTEAETHTQTGSTSQSLSQTYNIVEDLKVPSKTKIRALIKTYAVTHRAETIVQFSVDAKATLPVRFRPKFSRKYLGGIYKKEKFIRVSELLKDEDKFKIKDEILTFERKGNISYLSEEVEVTKEELIVA